MDADKLRSEWTSSLRPMLNLSSSALQEQSQFLLAHASEQERASSDPAVANIKVLDDGSIKLAAAPLDDSGQLTVRDPGAGEQPGSVVRALLSVPA